MKLEVLTDDNGYITSFGTINIMTDEEGNEYQASCINGATVIEIDEDLDAFYYIYNAYKIVDGAAVLDTDKAEQIYIENGLPYKTEQEKMLDSLTNIVNEVINE